MSRRSRQRILAVYTKELVELLRDRRTLIAMVVVPIALYPLLIIGSVHLLSIQDGERSFRKINIAVEHREGVPEEDQPATWVVEQLNLADYVYKQQPNGADDPDLQRKIDSVQKMKVETVDDVDQAVASGAYPVGVKLKLDTGGHPRYRQHRVAIIYDKAEVNSDSASARLQEVLETVATAVREQYGIPAEALAPILIDAVNVATPKKVGGMVLGTIVPLVLVLMTITGAIYPAIDLTAGERERGTLETLMVSPVPAIELITGKYLVVATVALFGAALNLLSMGATLYFGGFTEMIGAKDTTELPLDVLPVILLAMVPFALLFAALMVAVCSYARTFKEAQNYIMPVILAALIPGGIAAMPGTELAGVNRVVPVMNMVLMARELLLGNYDWTAIGLVMLSTSLYAATAVIIASRVFSTEDVVFADSGSLRNVFTRSLMQKTAEPSLSLALIVTALLFPTWMFVQVAMQPNEQQTILDTFVANARYMPLVLVGVPIALLLFFKVNVANSLSLRGCRLRYWLAAVLIGLGAWAPAHELFLLQGWIIPIPEAILASDVATREAFAGMSLWVPLALIALLPAVCEELFFRGFLFSGLRTSAGRWGTILTTACIFAVFHVLLIKFAVTASLGIVLGLICWRSRSIFPSMLAHLLHNGSAVLIGLWPTYKQTLGIAEIGPTGHLPAWIIALGTAMLAGGILLTHPFRPAGSPRPHPADDAGSMLASESGPDRPRQAPRRLDRS